MQVSRRQPPDVDGVDEVPDRQRNEGMAGLAKGLAILEAFGPGLKKLTIADAARHSGTTRSAARRCLLTLAALGYVNDDGKYFHPLPRLLRLGHGYLDAATLPQLAQPLLAIARDQLNESISLAILESHSCLFVARTEAERIVNAGVKVGARLPAYCSATGRVLLGGLTEEALSDHLRGQDIGKRTSHTLVTAEAITAAVDQARREGYAISDEELEVGLRSLAVAVKDSRGATIAAMSVSASSARVSKLTMLKNFLPVLQRAAEQLGRCL